MWLYLTFSLYRISVYTGFQFIQDFSLSRVRFRQVSLYLSDYWVHCLIWDNNIWLLQFDQFCRFRTTNHYLTIETGWWRNIDRGNTYCNLCNCQKLGDEYHYVLECSSLINCKMQTVFPKYFMKKHNIVKFSFNLCP